MFTIQLQLVDHMTDEPVGGADVTISPLTLESRWQENRPPAPDATWQGPEVVTVSGDRVEIASGSGITRLDVGTFAVSFDIDQHSEFFQGVEEELPEGPAYINSLAWSKPPGARWKINPVGTVNIGVAVAGVSGTDQVFDRLKSINDSWVKPIPIDLAKTIVGSATSDSVMLWFHWHDTSRPKYPCVCEIESPGAPDQRRSIFVEFSPPAQTAVLLLTGLRPATKYLYALRLLEGGVGPAGAGRILASGEFTTAPESTSSGGLSFVFASCHDPAMIGPRIVDDQSLERWKELAGRRDYDLMLLVGDQIYGDYINYLGHTWQERYANRYREMWAFPPVREVLRRTPTYMILDDHEVVDDWGSNPNIDRDRVDAALTAYRAFQHAHNPSGQDPTGPFYYHFRWGPAAFFVLDERSERGKSVAHPILGYQQFTDLYNWAKSEEAQRADIIFVVSTVPMAYLPVEQFKKLKKKSARRIGFKEGWKIGNEEVPILGAPIGAVIGYFRGPSVFESRWKEELTNKDLQDLWSYKPNQTELVGVLELLFDLANDRIEGSSGDHPRAVFILGGDVHLGARLVIESRMPKHRRNRFIHQLISSPISNAPAPMQDVLDVAKDVEKISPFPLDDTTKNFWVERWSTSDLLLYRNFGRVAVTRARRNRRVYRFSLAIEGKLESRWKEMELDLDAETIEPRPVSSPVVQGAIRDKWAELGGQQGFLGAPLTEETPTPDGAGRFTHFEGGSIYWHPEIGAHEVHGLIKEKWAELEWERGFLRYPLTDETTTPDGVGRFNHFQGGSIYWTPDTGAHEVHGDIRHKWAELEWERGFLGYPLTDETATPDGAGRFNHFQGGSVYWHPDTGAHEVHGAIRDRWAELGWEQGVLGYPISDETPAPDGGGRFSRFQRGSIHWTPEGGAQETLA